MVLPMHGHSDLSTASPGSDPAGDGAAPSRFLRNIRRFRSKGEQRRALAKGRENSQLLETMQGRLAALECVENVGERIELLARDLMAEAPGFHLARRLFDGRYVVELAVNRMGSDDSGRPKRELSRLAFMMEIQSEGGLSLECHATVRDHDLPLARLESSVCVGGELPDVDAFLDAQFLDFARAYYAGLVDESVGVDSVA